MESNKKVTLKMFGETNEKVAISFKNKNDELLSVDCVIGFDGTATLECNIQCTQDSQALQFKFTGCTVSQDKIILKIAGPANQEFDVSFKNANNEVTVNCVIGSDGTNVSEGSFEQPHFTGCTVSQDNMITLKIAGPANKEFDVFFKSTNNEVSTMCWF